MRTIIVGFAAMILLAGGRACADSLLRPNATTQQTLIAKQSDYRPGDIITVLIKESLESSVSSNMNTKKESDVQATAEEGANTFLVAKKPDGYGITTAEKLPNWQIEAENELKARGQTQRTSEFETTVPCTVTAVLQNGNLLIEGNRVVGINREDSRLFVRGMIRPRDISPGNTIPSTRIANAQIELKGRGPLWNNQRRGLITRLLDWISPY